MENNFDNNFVNDIKPIGRPQLLTVCCILTWVCCGLLLISSLSGLIPQSEEKKQQQLEQMRQISPEAADKMEAAMENSTGKTINTILGLLAIGLCAYGAAKMWQLKKIGFHLYLIGEILPYVGLAIGGADILSAASALGDGMGSAIVGVAITLMVLCDLVFIILYAVNLKHMNGDKQTQNAGVSF